MGQDCCCYRKTKNDLLKKKSDLQLNNDIDNVRHYRNQNFSFFVVYSSVTLASLIIVASGGTATLLLSATLTFSGAFYYIYEVRTQNAEIDEILKELKRREDAEISIVDTSSITIAKDYNCKLLRRKTL